jgi:hypothetical protein
MYFLISYFLLLMVAMALYNSFLLQDNFTPDNSPLDHKIKLKWHITGGIIFGMIAAGSYYVLDIYFALVVLSLFWLVYAGIVHHYALRVHFFAVGNSAISDRLLQQLSMMLKTSPELISGILKVGFLAVSVTLFILKHKN